MDVARPKSGDSFSTDKADYCRWKPKLVAPGRILTSPYRPPLLHSPPLILFHDELVI